MAAETSKGNTTAAGEAQTRHRPPPISSNPSRAEKTMTAIAIAIPVVVVVVVVTMAVALGGPGDSQNPCLRSACPVN